MVDIEKTLVDLVQKHEDLYEPFLTHSKRFHLVLLELKKYYPLRSLADIDKWSECLEKAGEAIKDMGKDIVAIAEFDKELFEIMSELAKQLGEMEKERTE